jgi:hypothetical protein
MRKKILFFIFFLIAGNIFAETKVIETKSNFDLGIYNNTVFDTVLKLNNSLTGDYQSEIFDFGREIDYLNISWEPIFPIGKELPNNNAVENIYASGNINMTDNVLLMHLNDSTGSTNFADSSSLNNSASCTDPNCPVSEDGVLGKSVKINGESLSRISIADNFNLNPNDKAFSICH